MSEAASRHDEPWRMRCPRGHTTWRAAPQAAQHNYRCGQCRDLNGVDHKFQQLWDAAEWDFPVSYSERPPIPQSVRPSCNTQMQGPTTWGWRTVGEGRIPDSATPCQQCYHEGAAVDKSDTVVIDTSHATPSRMRYHKPEVETGARATLTPLQIAGVTGLLGLIWLTALFAAVVMLP